MRRASRLVIVLTLVASGVCLSAWAQHEESPADICFRNFNMEKAVTSKAFLDFVRDRNVNLFDYLYCRGALDENFLPGVRALGWIRGSTYLDMGTRFDWYQFWIALARARTITSKMVTDCARVNDTDGQTCKALMDAFMRRDASVCDRLVKPGTEDHAMCRAEVLRDPVIVIDHNRTEVDNMYLLKAVSERNVPVCENIRRPLVRMMCRAAVLENVAECEKYNNFGVFKRRYCDAVN